MAVDEPVGEGEPALADDDPVARRPAQVIGSGGGGEVAGEGEHPSLGRVGGRAGLEGVEEGGGGEVGRRAAPTTAASLVFACPATGALAMTSTLPLIARPPGARWAGGGRPAARFLVGMVRQ